MRHICAWCGCETAKPDGAADDNIISHGICEKCKKVALAEIKPDHTNNREGRK